MYTYFTSKKIALALGLTFGLSALNSAHAAASTYDVDSRHAAIYVSVNHMGASTTVIRFTDLKGEIILDTEAKRGQASVTVNADTLSTGLADFDTMLKANYINTAKYPEFKFTSKDFKFDGDKVRAVNGELTLMGKTLPITLKSTQFNCFTSVSKKAACGGDFKTTIERSKWGVTEGLDFGLADKIDVTMQIEAFKRP